MSQFRLRLMCVEDLHRVGQIEAEAFSYIAHEMPSSPGYVPPRCQAYLQAALWKAPDGCFVAEDAGGDVCGAVFSTVWGGVGWVGYLSVRPDMQGKGIGTALTRQSLAFLRVQARHVIGLETRADRAQNVGFYERLGFEVRCVTLFMTRRIGHAPECTGPKVLRWSSLSQRDKALCLTEARHITGQLGCHVDYSREILACDRFGLGDTLFCMHRDEPVGFAVVHTVPRRGLLLEPGYVHIMAFAPPHLAITHLADFLDAVNQTCASVHKSEVEIAVNGCYRNAVKSLLDAGFKVRRLMVRMVYTGIEECCPDPSNLDCSSWSG